MNIGHWPPEAIVTVVVFLLTSLAWPIKAALTLWSKGSDHAHDLHRQVMEHSAKKDEQIDNLRVLLARSARRETAWITGSELLLIAMPSELSAEQLRILARARQVFETAVIRSGGGASGD